MQVMTARDAVELVKSGDTVVIGGVVSLVTPEATVRALGDRFRRTGFPRDLTLICPNRIGWSSELGPHGLEHLAHKGMVKRLLASSFSAKVSPGFVKLVMDGEIETQVVPMGVLFRWLRECTAKSPGLLTEVGIGTFFDPAGRMRAGAENKERDASSRQFAKRVTVDETECIFMPSMLIDVALIRGTVADVDGNISLTGEPISAGVRQMAMAAKTSGGKVIAVVKTLTDRGTLHPRMVEVPGIFVDAVVVDSQAIQTQCSYEPAFTGEIRTPAPPLPQLPMSCQKVILRRAALELAKGDVVNLGFGMGTQLPGLAHEEGFLNDITFSIEHGALGGVPAAGGFDGAFGAHYNPHAIIDSTDVFDFYHGGGLNAAVLGFAEVDALGNVNVGGNYSGSIRGPGGFVDITHRTRKVLICGTLTSGGLEARFNGRGGTEADIRILREGRHRKFPRQVEHIDLYGAGSLERGQRLLVITERCVFELRKPGLTLIEVARGVDITRDVKPQLDFDLRIAEELRTMPAAVFQDGQMGLRLKDEK
ncbi:MAG: hypothetical protein HY525_10845 [Betaproteobacteria bacterium]|nr:hypothetical protein [Betaproteobacteria bacterium]